MSSPSMPSADMRQRTTTRRAHRIAISGLVLLLSACATGPGARDVEPEREIALPPVPEIEIPEAAYTDFAAAINYIDRGDDDAAERALRNIIRVYPQIAGPYINLAGLLERDGRYAEALEFARQAVERNPRSAPGYNLQGLLERHAGNFDAAEMAYRNALAADPGFMQAQRNLGILYDLYLRQPRKALAAYEAYQAMLPEPDDTVAIWIADLKRRTGA